MIKDWHNKVTLLGGSSNLNLTSEIGHAMGLPIGRCEVGRFPDGEVHIELEEDVGGHHVFIIQSTSPPVNDHLIELLIIADTCRRARANHITAVIPYFGYARSDKRNGQGAVTARMIADLLQVVGMDQVITVDLHAPQIEGFFQIPLTNLTGVPILSDALREAHSTDGLAIVSPDAGRIGMAAIYAHRLGLPTVVLQKSRVSGSEMEIKLLHGDPANKTCVIIDDMLTTGNTVTKSFETLLQAGSRSNFIVVATHGLFIPGAREKLTDLGIHEVYVTNTVSGRETDWSKLKVVSVARLIATEIMRVAGL